MRSKLVIANWKMNGSSSFLAQMAQRFQVEVSAGYGGTNTVVICPPAIYLFSLKEQLVATGIELGAQNTSDQVAGAFTGEVSAQMLSDAGCEWVLVGHSERRALYGETSELVANKARVALKSGLKTVVCVGETLEDRQSGNTEKVIADQLRPVLQIEGLAEYDSQFVVAYEPVWAIGTGVTASPEQAQQVHRFIRTELGNDMSDVSVLYGGSVKPDNAADLFSQEDIDGGLIGGASLDAEDFLTICRAMPG